MVYHTERAELVQNGERHVGLDRQNQYQALGLAVLGQESNACFYSIVRSLDIHQTALQEHLTRVAVVRAKHDTSHLGSACTYQSGHAHDFPPAHVERHVVERALAGESVHLQYFIARFHLHFGEMLVEAAPHHKAYQIGNRGAANVQRADVSAVAEYGHTVGNRKKLFKPVRYIQDRYPLRLESAEYAEEFPYLPLREARCGFIQDQNRRLPGQRVGYLNHLLLSDAQL